MISADVHFSQPFIGRDFTTETKDSLGTTLQASMQRETSDAPAAAAKNGQIQTKVCMPFTKVQNANSDQYLSKTQNKHQMDHRHQTQRSDLTPETSCFQSDSFTIPEYDLTVGNLNAELTINLRYRDVSRLISILEMTGSKGYDSVSECVDVSSIMRNDQIMEKP